MLFSVAGWVSWLLLSLLAVSQAESGFSFFCHFRILLSLEYLFHHHFHQLLWVKHGGVFCSCVDSV